MGPLFSKMKQTPDANREPINPRGKAAADWKRPPRDWFEAKTQFAVIFKERFVLA
jgi:hypothetical protein